MNDWQALYGVKLWPQVMHGQPAIIEAAHGDGRVVLSYAHLETPASPEANAWLTHLLTRLTDVRPASGLIPAWDLETLPVEWDDPALTRAAGQMAEIVRLGREHLLLYWRNPWLLGWRRGIPGAALSSLTALIRQISAHEPGNDALEFWSQASVEFTRHMDLFHRGLTGYLLAERLAMTLSAANDAECLPGLAQQKQALFGPPPAGGGLYARLSAPLERLARRVLDTPPTGCE